MFWMLLMFASAAQLEVRVDVPDQDVVVVRIDDVSPGDVREVSFAGNGRVDYRISVEVQASEPDLWQVALGLESQRRGRKRAEPTVLARPTLVARTGQQAVFSYGAETPLAEQSGVFTFEGVRLSFQVTEPAE